MKHDRHNAIKIKEAAQATVHGKISALDQEGLVRYFASTQTNFPKDAPIQNKTLLVCEPVAVYPKTEA